MGIYDVKTFQNTLTVTLEGKFTNEDTLSFLKAFNDGVKKIVPANTELIFHASKFQVLPADMHDALGNCFKLYKSLGFKKITMDMGDNVIVIMQVKRIAKEVGLDNFDIV